MEAVFREYEDAYVLGDRETLIADARYQFIQKVVGVCVKRGRPLALPPCPTGWMPSSPTSSWPSRYSC